MPASRWAMPPSVIYVLVVVAVSTAVNLVALQLIPLILCVLVLVGVVSGHRLAWQWGRVLVPLGAVLLLLSSVCAGASLGGRNDPTLGAIVFVVNLTMAFFLFSIFFALGRPAARNYFELICPRCGTSTSQAGDFFFNVAVCPKCNLRWRSRVDYFRSTEAADRELDDIPMVERVEEPPETFGRDENIKPG